MNCIGSSFCIASMLFVELFSSHDPEVLVEQCPVGRLTKSLHCGRRTLVVHHKDRPLLLRPAAGDEPVILRIVHQRRNMPALVYFEDNWWLRMLPRP